MKVFIIVLQLFTLTIAKAQTVDRLSNKSLLIDAIFVNEELKTTIQNGKIAVLKAQFCIDNDCETFFKNYKDKIAVYTKGDLFQRGITKYIEIERFDEHQGLVILKAKTIGDKGKDKHLVIKL